MGSLIFVPKEKGYKMNGTGKMTPLATPQTVLLSKAPTGPIKGAPKRCAIDPTVCYAIDGLIEGLEDVHFSFEILPMSVKHFKMQLKLEDYEMSEEVWKKLQGYSCDEQAKIIMAMVRNVHLCRALDRLRGGEGPLGRLRGCEHKALPLALAGETNCREILEELKPLLPRFGLDKGATRGKTGGVDYPSVMNLFFRNRRQFFQVYRIEGDYTAMLRFLMAMKYRPNLDWPEALTKPFEDEDTARDALNQIAVHYF